MSSNAPSINTQSEVASNTKGEAANVECQNCHTPLSGHYCSQCGQDSNDTIRPFWDYLKEAFEDWLSLDSKFFRTLWALVFRPGFLSAQYFSGRRVRYVTPVRLFVIANVLFFFLFPYLSDIRLDNERNDSLEDKAVIAQLDDRIKLLEGQDSKAAPLAIYHKQLLELRTKLEASDKRNTASVLLALIQIQLDRKEPDYRLSKAQLDDLKDLEVALKTISAEGDMPNWDLDWDDSAGSTEASTGPEKTDDGKDLLTKEPLLSEASGTAETVEDSREENETLMNIARSLNDSPEKVANQAGDIISTLMFVLLPIFALLLRLCYVFKPRLYMEHLTIALHGQSFVFVVILLIMSLDQLANSFPVLVDALDWVATILFLWLPIYILLLQRRAYGQSWPKTIFMFCLTSCLYMGLILLALFGAVVLGVQTL